MQLFLKNEITLYVYKKHYIVCSGRDPGEINIEAHVRNSKKKLVYGIVLFITMNHTIHRFNINT